MNSKQHLVPPLLLALLLGAAAGVTRHNLRYQCAALQAAETETRVLLHAADELHQQTRELRKTLTENRVLREKQLELNRFQPIAAEAPPPLPPQVVRAETVDFSALDSRDPSWRHQRLRDKLSAWADARIMALDSFAEIRMSPEQREEAKRLRDLLRDIGSAPANSAELAAEAAALMDRLRPFLLEQRRIDSGSPAAQARQEALELEKLHQNTSLYGFTWRGGPAPPPGL